jgi:hypothetical protein
MKYETLLSFDNSRVGYNILFSRTYDTVLLWSKCGQLISWDLRPTNGICQQSRAANTLDVDPSHICGVRHVLDRVLSGYTYTWSLIWWWRSRQRGELAEALVWARQQVGAVDLDSISTSDWALITAFTDTDKQHARTHDQRQVHTARRMPRTCASTDKTRSSCFVFTEQLTT